MGRTQGSPLQTLLGRKSPRIPCPGLRSLSRCVGHPDRRCRHPMTRRLKRLRQVSSASGVTWNPRDRADLVQTRQGRWKLRPGLRRSIRAKTRRGPSRSSTRSLEVRRTRIARSEERSPRGAPGIRPQADDSLSRATQCVPPSPPPRLDLKDVTCDGVRCEQQRGGGMGIARTLRRSIAVDAQVCANGVRPRLHAVLWGAAGGAAGALLYNRAMRGAARERAGGLLPAAAEQVGGEGLTAEARRTQRGRMGSGTTTFLLWFEGVFLLVSCQSCASFACG